MPCRPVNGRSQKARERGSNFHIVCLLFIRGLGLGQLRPPFGFFGRSARRHATQRDESRAILAAAAAQHAGVVAQRDVRHRGGGPPEPGRQHHCARNEFSRRGRELADQSGAQLSRSRGTRQGTTSIFQRPERCLPKMSGSAGCTRFVSMPHVPSTGWRRAIPPKPAGVRRHLSSSPGRHADGSTSRGRASCSATLPRWRTGHEKPLRHYEAGLSSLQRHPCPSVQWKISAALAAAHATLHQSEEAEQWRAATQRVLRDLAASIREGPLQTRFRQSRVVREFRAG